MLSQMAGWLKVSVYLDLFFEGALICWKEACAVILDLTLFHLTVYSLLSSFKLLKNQCVYF